MIDARKRTFVLVGLLALAGLLAGMARLVPIRMGRQPDGRFMVSSGQRIEGDSIAFKGRPIDLAVHPRDGVFAVLNRSEVLLFRASGTPAGRRTSLFSMDGETTAGFRGLAWSPDGSRLFASTDRPFIRVFTYQGGRLKSADRIPVQPRRTRGNAVPGGMAITPRPTMTPSPRST